MEDKKSLFEKITGITSSDDQSENTQNAGFDIPDKSVQYDEPKAIPALKKITVNEEEGNSKRPSEELLKEYGSSEDEEGQLVLDVYQTDNEIVVKSTLAGVKPEDIDITITNDMLTIKGVREKDEEVKKDDYFYQECYWGVFSRSVILPTEVEEDKVKASLKNGILTIRMPKKEKIKTKKISVTEE